MAKVYAFLADGLEEVECLAVVDVLRRSGIETVLVSVSGKQEITGSHGIRLMADVLFEEAGLRLSVRRPVFWALWGF